MITYFHLVFILFIILLLFDFILYTINSNKINKIENMTNNIKITCRVCNKQLYFGNLYNNNHPYCTQKCYNDDMSSKNISIGIFHNIIVKN